MKKLGIIQPGKIGADYEYVIVQERVCYFYK